MNRRILLAMALPLLAGAGFLPTAEQGLVRGRVVDGTGAPLPLVQVYVVGNGIIGSLSRATGVFVMPSVPAGAYEIRAERIGFASRTQQIVVGEGAEVVVNFELLLSAVGLDEITSNGTRAPQAENIGAPSVSPAPGALDLTGAPSFTPFTVRPELRNLAEVQRAMVAAYPPEMRTAGKGGTVMVRLYLSEAGEVQGQELRGFSSAEFASEQALIEAARTASAVARFSPAYNYDQRVPVWVQFPMTFRP